MADITLLKLNLEGATFNAPGAGTDAATSEPSAEPSTEDDGSRSPGRGVALGALVGLGFLIAVALVAKRRLGGSPAEQEDDTGATVTLDAD